MKKKKLEIYLEGIPRYEKPTPELEQYVTPANIASDIIFIAYQLGDIENKTIIDLGCGTGIFSIGASLAGAKNVIGIDIDEDAIILAKTFANENKLKIEFLNEDIKEIQIPGDTVVMNPPFGAQKSNKQADRRFIEKGFELAPVIYSLHLTKTIPFIEKMISSLQGNIDFSKDYKFPIKQIFDFHKKKVIDFEVTLLRVLTKK